ncbi:connector enhancer of kinase suppressor of ras 3-like, partial [Haemaphysalis longicornis]
MAYINIAEWTPEHVADWLRGLDDIIIPYVHFFLNNNIDGHHLLTLGPDDLSSLNIAKAGHQELILEAVDQLRQLHYKLITENLQSLALKLGCRARSVYNDIKRITPSEQDSATKIATSILADVSEVLLAVKAFVSWLDRAPFEGQERYTNIRQAVLKLGIELASTAQRDHFAAKPYAVIQSSCYNLADICDIIIQECHDSLIIQPASLDVATVKKKTEEEWGMQINSSYSGIHVVGGVKFQSPSHRCGKVDVGDEIVQINYQTVVGWQLKHLVYMLQEHPTEVLLTLKKRPRHTNILGQ